MSDVYKLETRVGHRNETGYLYEVTRNGVPILSDVNYVVAYNHVVGVIADDDRYQEVSAGFTRCDLSGKALKESHRRRRGN